MKKSNVLLIVLDTLRRDTLYNNLDKLPNLKKLASESTVYRNAVSPSPWTIPTHASIFTGLYPSEHGMTMRFNDSEMVRAISSFPQQNKTFQEKLRAEGYKTILVSANILVGKDTAFQQGFDQVVNVGPVVKQMEYSRQQHALSNGEPLNKYQSIGKLFELRKLIGTSNLLKIISLGVRRRLYNRRIGFPHYKGHKDVLQEFINSNPKSPFLAVLNCIEMHEPYNFRRSKMKFFDSRDSFEIARRSYFRASFTGNLEGAEKHSSTLESAREALLNEVQLVDEFIGSLVQYLKSSGSYDDSIIVVTSDHGQSMGENLYIGHEYKLNDAVVNVPLLIKIPGKSPSTVDDYVNTVDIYDFILGVAKDGSSGMALHDYVFSEAFGYNEPKWNLFLGDMAKEYPPEIRKRVWSQNGYSLTVNGSRGTIEEFSHHCNPVEISENLEIAQTLLDELMIFAGNSEFLFPSDPIKPPKA